MSWPYTPAQNGWAERKHRHITETGLAMMFHAHMAPIFWFDAFSAAVYTINRLPTPLLQQKSRYELLFSHPPNYENFHPFGCRVYPCLRDYATNKFSHRSVPCIFLGYINNHKGFRCFDTLTTRLYITRHAQFDQKCFPLADKPQNTPISDLDFSSFMESCISSTGFSPPRKTTPATPAP